MTDYTVGIGWTENAAIASSGDPTFDEFFQGLRVTKTPSDPEEVLRLKTLTTFSS